MLKKISIASLLSITLIACQNEKVINETPLNIEKTDSTVLKMGFEVLNSNCFTCHSPNAGKDERIAPPMKGIKMHYLTEGISKEEFIQNIVAFVANPSAENAKMPGAVEKFGVMPKMGFSDEQMTAAAEYIYSQALESPNWFQKHYETERAKYSQTIDSTKINTVERGQQMAMQAKAVLGKNLMGAIDKKGTDGALTFCNIKAFPIVDSMGTVLNAHITRVSDLPRNEKNLANTNEMAFIKLTKERIANSEKLKPMLRQENGKNIGYYPITTNEMCLQCHGKLKEQVKESTLSLLSKLYPKDKATGYSENELRGIWVVTF